METNEHFLADWLDGKITDDQLRKRVSPDDFNAYLEIRDALSSSQIADPDIASNFARTKQKLASGIRPRYRRARSFGYAAVMAACVILAMALFNIFTFAPQTKTGSAHTASWISDDGTVIQLNTGSSLERIRWFSLNRKVRMDGEAYFEVRKGRPFSVSTPEGKVEVMGTKFNVISRKGYFEVVCYEGRVRVQSGDFSADLTKGEAFRRYRSESEEYSVLDEMPTWTGLESTFSKTPVEVVIDRLSSRYGYQVDYPQQLKSVRFTGSFTHADLDTALRSVLNPLGMKYEIEGKTIRVHP